MMLKWSVAAVLGTLLFFVTAVVSLAQAEPPPPYAGLKNPFAWTDVQAQAAGKKPYEQFCLACHGAGGKGVRNFDFSLPDYSRNLEAKPDFYFWVFSEGRLNKGMPAYKSSISESERWQILTYIWALGTAPPPPVAPPTAKPPVVGASLTLTSPGEIKTGQETIFTAVLKDAQGKPISRETVEFLFLVDFFAHDQMRIGKAITNETGIATLQYVPRVAGESVTARYGETEATAKLSITDSGEIFYKPEAGIKLPSPGPEVFIGPKSARELGQESFAPTSAFRLPNGIFSSLWLFVGALVLVWGTYFIAMYQLLGISTLREIGLNRENRLIPLVGLGVVLVLGVLMVLMVITGPHSHLHLLP